MFLTPTTFQEKIEDEVWMKDCTYIEAIMTFCKDNETDFEDIAKLITSNLKDKIRLDAMNEGLMKREAQLPI
jgi:hypothetical protein